jgi:FAD/FMN-containing dehydrogenase
VDSLAPVVGLEPTTCGKSPTLNRYKYCKSNGHKFNDAALLAYGHIGDGNLHFSIYPGASRDRDAVDELVYYPLQALHGSVSAEHGIGLEKKAYLKYTRSESEIALMRRLKRMMDPDNIMNPGKVFDL